MQEHYGETKAGQQAGAVTYFGFLSVFPILALAFFVVGYVAKVYPRRPGHPASTRSSRCFPGIIGTGDNQLQLDGHRGRRRRPSASSAWSASSTPASAGSRPCATP